MTNVTSTRIAFLGDSLTQHGIWFLESQRIISKALPHFHASFINCGVGGDAAHLCLSRFEWDLDPLNPTHVVIMFGANDVDYDDYKNDNVSRAISKQDFIVERYSASLQRIISVILDKGMVPIVASPAPFFVDGNETHNHLLVNKTLLLISEAAKRICIERSCLFIDVNMRFTKAISDWRGPIASVLYSDDHLHMLPDGYKFMGLCAAIDYLESMHIKPIPYSIPDNLQDLQTICPPFNSAMLYQYEIEQKIRWVSFYKHMVTKWRKWNTLTLENQLIAAFERYDKPDTPDWEKDAVKHFAIYHNQIPELIAEAEKARNSVIFNINK